MRKTVMMRITNRRPSAAMVVSVIALFVALGGTGYAASQLPKNSVGSAQVINGSLQKADLAKKTISALKGSATIKGVAAGGDLAGTYPNPVVANGAITSTKLAASESWHSVGGVNEPAFQNSWVNASLGASPTDAAFMKDVTGVVSIRGQVKGGTVSPTVGVGTVFVLPAGYRPSSYRYFSVLTTDGNNVITPGWVGIDSAGDVQVGVGDNHFVSLDLSFRP